MQGLLLAVLAMVVFAPQLPAQRLDDVRPGTRVRLTIHDSREPVVGLLEDTPAADTIRLRDSSGALMAIARSEIGRAEVSWASLTRWEGSVARAPGRLRGSDSPRYKL